MLHDAYLGALLIKGFDGAVEALAGLFIAMTGFQRIYGWVIRLTAPELAGHHPAINAIRNGAARLAEGPHHFVVVYLLAHGLLKLGIVVALLKGGSRWVFPAASLVLLGFIVYMGWRLTLHWSDWLLGFALFDCITLALVLNEWHNPTSIRTASLPG